MAKQSEHLLSLEAFNALVSDHPYESGSMNREVVMGNIVVCALVVKDKIRFYSADRLIHSMPTAGLRIFLVHETLEVRVAADGSRTTRGPHGGIVVEDGNFVSLNFKLANKE